MRIWVKGAFVIDALRETRNNQNRPENLMFSVFSQCAVLLVVRRPESLSTHVKGASDRRLLLWTTPGLPLCVYTRRAALGPARVYGCHTLWSGYAIELQHRWCMKRLLLLASAMASFATGDNAWTQRELRTTNSMRIVTWNLWFDHRRQSERLKLLLATLAKENADVIGLQEIVPDVAARIRQHAGVTARYDISENKISGYGCLLLVRRELNPAFAELPLPTTMGRSLVAAEIDTYGHAGTRRRVVGTVHLESLDSEPTRAAQLRQISAVEGLDVLCGDFNFDDVATWGEWIDPRRKRPPAALENNVLARTLPDFVDAWSTVFSKHSGLTFDGATNPWIRDRGERMRYDRVLVRKSLGRPVAAERLGASPAADGLFASDHYGLRVDVVML